MGRYFLERLRLEVHSLEAEEVWPETTGWMNTNGGCCTTGCTTFTVGFTPQGFIAGGLSAG